MGRPAAKGNRSCVNPEGNSISVNTVIAADGKEMDIPAVGIDEPHDVAVETYSAEEQGFLPIDISELGILQRY